MIGNFNKIDLLTEFRNIRILKRKPNNEEKTMAKDFFLNILNGKSGKYLKIIV